MTEEKTKIIKRIIKDPITGRFKGVSEQEVSLDSHNASMEEAPPPGVEGPLTIEKPPTHGGITASQLEKSRKESKVISHAEESLPTGDRD